MPMRLVVLSLFMMALLAACDGALPAQPATNPSVVGQTADGTPQGGPRANRTLPPNFTPPANFTPGGQRPGGPSGPGAQRTPQAAATNAPGSATSEPTRAAPTAVVGSIITSTSNIAPTAVPIPQVIIPTPVPISAPANTPLPTPNTTPSASSLATTPTPKPVTLESLHGQIVFTSDRDSPYPQLYVMAPDGSNVRPCNCTDLLETLATKDYTSPDQKLFLFVKQVGGLRNRNDTQIWVHNNDTNEDSVVTGDPPGFHGANYDPVWSPDSRHIAWVSETDGNDEIYLHDIPTNENKRLTQNTWEFDKHPSFSPDGSQIVFWSNRDSGTKQIWVMNLDGSNQHNISQNQYNDSDPIWVK